MGPGLPSPPFVLVIRMAVCVAGPHKAPTGAELSTLTARGLAPRHPTPRPCHPQCCMEPLPVPNFQGHVSIAVIRTVQHTARPTVCSGPAHVVLRLPPLPVADTGCQLLFPLRSLIGPSSRRGAPVGFPSPRAHLSDLLGAGRHVQSSWPEHLSPPAGHVTLGPSFCASACPPAPGTAAGIQRMGSSAGQGAAWLDGCEVLPGQVGWGWRCVLVLPSLRAGRRAQLCLLPTQSPTTLPPPGCQ